VRWPGRLKTYQSEQRKRQPAKNEPQTTTTTATTATTTRAFDSSKENARFKSIVRGGIYFFVRKLVRRRFETKLAKFDTLSATKIELATPHGLAIVWRGGKTKKKENKKMKKKCK